MMKYRRNDSAGLPVLAILAIVVAVALVSVVVVYPYYVRADDYANNPTDPPDDVIIDEDEDPAPDWQGKLAMPVTVKTSMNVYTDVDVSSISIGDLDMTLEDYDGQPWSVASMFAAWFKPPAQKYEVKYDLTFQKGSTTYEDKGSFFVYYSDGYKNTGKTLYFFFWEEQEGNWNYELTVTCKGKTAHATGTLGLSGGKALVN
jgi:hypothetical protein